MPTLDDMETAIADLRRTANLVADLQTRRASLLAQVDDIDAQLLNLETATKANDAKVREVAKQFAGGR